MSVRFLSYLLAFTFACGHAHGELIINLDFTNFNSTAPADGSAILGGATRLQAQNVIQEAANIWEAAFANSSSSIAWSSNVGGTLTQTIDVSWAPKGGTTLATGGTNWFLSDGRWGSGSLEWDNDGTSQFFVDPTPSEHSEWQQFSERDLSFNGVDVNVERVHFDAPAGVARSNSDMLTVAVHEIGHALGFLGTFPAFAASDLGSDNDIDITSGALNGAQIPVDGGHTDFVIQSPSTQFPYDPGPGFIFPPFDYGPNVLSPSIQTGTRKLLTESDIATTAQFLEFDMNTVNFNPQMAAVPEPSSFLVLNGLVIGGLFLRRRRSRQADDTQS